jgi:hypothetical protein
VIANVLVVLAVWLVFGVVTALVLGRLLAGRYVPGAGRRKNRPAATRPARGDDRVGHRSEKVEV